MNCFDFRSLLAPYLDGDLAASEARLLERHVARCDECRHELETLQDSGGALIALRGDTASHALRLRVMVALQEAASKGGILRRRPKIRWGLPTLAAAMAASAGAFFLWPRHDPAGEILDRMETAVRQSRSLHMTCRWYKPTDPEKMVTQREIWRDGSTSRWDEAGGTTAILEPHRMRLVRAGQGQLPAQAVSLCRVPTMEVMLSGIVRINGVAVETEEGVSWHGTTYRALIVRDRGLDGSPLRTIFLLDPESSLPVKGEQQKQVDGRWKTEGTLQFEFNRPIKADIFSPA